jgi:protein-tyrosine phosphatase
MKLVVLLRGGAGVAIHCRQSVGRSGLLAVSMLVRVRQRSWRRPLRPFRWRVAFA